MATPGLSIPDLLKIVRHSVSETEFNEVQQMLMDRDKMMKMELEDLKRDFDAMKTEACLQERYHSLAEFEKIRIEEKLQLSQRKCLELNEEITRLKEELKISLERAKRAEERRDIVSKEFYKMISEKNKTILDLNAKINDLQNKNLEMNEQLVVELRQKQSEADKEVAELKRQNFEATQKLEERVIRMETGIGNMLNVKAEDLAGLAAFIDKFAAANGENVCLSDMIKVWRDSLITDSTVDPENIAIVSDVACGTSNAVASDDTPLVMEGIVLNSYLILVLINNMIVFIVFFGEVISLSRSDSRAAC